MLMPWRKSLLEVVLLEGVEVEVLEGAELDLELDIVVGVPTACVEDVFEAAAVVLAWLVVL